MSENVWDQKFGFSCFFCGLIANKKNAKSPNGSFNGLISRLRSLFFIRGLAKGGMQAWTVWRRRLIRVTP